MRFRTDRKLNIEPLEARRLLVASVDIPDDIVAQPGSQVSAQVLIQESTGTRAAEVRLSFDPQVLTLGDTDVVAGGVWGANAQVVANVDQATGTLVAFVFAAEAFPSSNGSLLELRFGVRSTAVVGTSTILDLSKVELNEGQIIVSPAPQSGADTTDGRISIVAGSTTGTGRVSGFVFADANQNGNRDLSEAIPEVTIELVDAAGAVRSTKTDNQGSYSFGNVTAGLFTLRELQPLAYIDGGSNTVSLTLNDQQNLGEQNFKELGLKAEYVYNRLLTTPVQPAGSLNWIATIVQIQHDAGSEVIASQLSNNQAPRAAFSLSSSTGANQLISQELMHQDVLPNNFEYNSLTAASDELSFEGESILSNRVVAPPVTPFSPILPAILASTQLHPPLSSGTLQSILSTPARVAFPTFDSQTQSSAIGDTAMERDQANNTSSVDEVFGSLSDTDRIWEIL